MLNQLFNDVFTSTAVKPLTMMGAIGVALVLGLVVAKVYQYKTVYSKSFVMSLALLPTLIAVVIFLVNGSLGAGVAVMGAFSLIRFRSAPGGAKELVSIFLAMTIGIAIGMGYLVFAGAFTLIMSVAIILLETINFGQMKHSIRQLTIVIPESLDYESIFDDIFDKATNHLELASVKTSDMGSLFKLKYIIQLNGKMTEKELMDALRHPERQEEIGPLVALSQKKMNYKIHRKRPIMKTSKKTIFRKVKLMVPLVLLTASLGACSLISKSSAASTNTTTSSTTSKKASTASTSYFTDRDQDASYDESSATKVSLSGSTAKVSGDGAKVSGSTVTITAAGTYVLSGSSENVQIVVKAGDQDKVQIVLNGVTMKGTDAAIVVESADKTFITLAEGSKNSISDSANHTNTDYDAAIYSKDDLTFNGSGSLTIEGNYGNAVESNDDLRITGGTYTVKGYKNALSANDALNIKDATLNLTATEDALHADNDEDTTLGNLYIQSGTITINAGDDGMHASNAAVIDGGTITVSKSIEALEGTNVTINDGKLDLYATDDGINASSKVTGANIFIKITGGDIKVEVGQGDTDALDSNGDIIMTGGNLDITSTVSAFDFDGTATYTGGTITVNGETRSEITADGPGGGGAPGGNQGGGPGGH